MLRTIYIVRAVNTMNNFDYCLILIVEWRSSLDDESNAIIQLHFHSIYNILDYLRYANSIFVIVRFKQYIEVTNNDLKLFKWLN